MGLRDGLQGWASGTSFRDGLSPCRRSSPGRRSPVPIPAGAVTPGVTVANRHKTCPDAAFAERLLWQPEPGESRERGAKSQGRVDSSPRTFRRASRVRLRLWKRGVLQKMYWVDGKTSEFMVFFINFSQLSTFPKVSNWKKNRKKN